jgi:hypothetical protein
MAEIGKFVDKAYEDMTFAELVKAPISALQGLSESDGEALAKALNIKSIGDLANNKFVLWAQAISALSK